MKTIEERARKYATKSTTPWDAPVIDHVAGEHYAIGAAEQKKIDIDKACEYFADWMRRHNDYAQFAVDGLRKAMEEE